MSHNVHHSTYPLNCDRRKVQSEWDHYAAMEDWQEGCSGLPGSIRWLEREPICSSYEEAERRIEQLDSGWYDQLAIRYYAVKGDVSKKSKASENAKISYEAAVKAQDELVTKVNSAFFNRKSELVGCKSCGSKLALKYLKATNCPLCKNTLLSDTDVSRMEKAVERVRTTMEKYRFETEKDTQRTLKQEKNREVRWLVKIEYHT